MEFWFSITTLRLPPHLIPPLSYVELDTWIWLPNYMTSSQSKSNDLHQILMSIVNQCKELLHQLCLLLKPFSPLSKFSNPPIISPTTDLFYTCIFLFQIKEKPCKFMLQTLTPTPSILPKSSTWPIPIFHTTKSTNHLSSSLLHILFMFIHQIDSFDVIPQSLNPCQLKYLESNTLSNSSPLLWKRFHLHLASKTKLNKDTSLTPKPQFSLKSHL